MDRLGKIKINIIRRAYIAGHPNRARLAAQLGTNWDTVAKYFKEFQKIEQDFPKKLKDFNFFLPRGNKVPKLTYYNELMSVLPRLVEETKTNCLYKNEIWERYRDIYPKGCGLYYFYHYFNEWQKQNKICKYYPLRVKEISEDAMRELNQWRLSNDTELWRKAVIIQDCFKKRPVDEISAQIALSVESILKCIATFKEKGIDGIRRKPCPNYHIAGNQKKQSQILRLLQQTPKDFGVNRASWSLAALSRVYVVTYGEPLSTHAISSHLKKMGYRFEKSREKLISKDKDFEEKLNNLKRILSGLKPDEKFFSIDEYGPAYIKKRGGRSLTKIGEIITIPPFQKHKGWFIMTAAIELSTNQVTHFYSDHKNTAEMIKLLDILSLQYIAERKLYISWDDAAWHRSKSLKAYITEVNAPGYRQQYATPEVELVPLPSCAPYLNVIESVFSGMARAVVHNSDYGSVAECQAALDLYFLERNEHFRVNPRKAGKQIWGKEIVAPVFDESQNCKQRLIKS
ncbi:MAG: IS630 family transposase [Bacteroidota bacterium]